MGVSVQTISQHHNDTPSKSIAACSAAAAIVLVGGALRLYRIDTPPLMHDEAYSYLTASRSLSGIVSELKLDSGPPLYYVVLHYWMKWFGASEYAMRLLSAVLGTALIGMVMWLGRCLYSTPVSLLAGLIISTAPIQVHYSQKARMYTLVPLLAAAALFFAIRYVRTSHRRDLFFCVLTTILALYTHNFMVFVCPALGAILLLEGDWARRWKRFLVFGGGVGLGYLPWLPVLATQLRNPDPFAWFQNVWEKWGPIKAVAWTLSSFSHGGSQPFIVDGFNVKGSLWPVVLFVLLAAFGAGMMFHRHRRSSIALSVGPMIFVALPLAGSAIASMVLMPNYAAGRVGQIVFPAFCLVVAIGLSAIRPRIVAIGVAVAAISSSFWILDRYYDQTYAPSDREIADHVADRLPPGATMVCTSLTRTTLTYYLKRRGFNANLLSFPKSTSRHLGYQNDAALLSDPKKLQAEASRIVEELRRTLEIGDQFCLVHAGQAVNSALAEALIRAPDIRQTSPPFLAMQWGMGTSIYVSVFRLGP
jgi:4-amino-4-deoxy-L-arabinose transferase-like glycosyltransferase